MFEYSSWAEGEPNKMNERCAMKRGTGWSDVVCGPKTRPAFICQYDWINII